MSQRQLAQQSGVDHSTISRLIRGDRTPSLGTATKLARGLREIRDEGDTPGYFGVVAVAPRTRPLASSTHCVRTRPGAAGPTDHGVLPGSPRAPVRADLLQRRFPRARDPNGNGSLSSRLVYGRPPERHHRRRRGSRGPRPSPPRYGVQRPPARPPTRTRVDHRTSPGHDLNVPPRSGLGDSERRSAGAGVRIFRGLRRRPAAPPRPRAARSRPPPGPRHRAAEHARRPRRPPGPPRSPARSPRPPPRRDARPPPYTYQVSEASIGPPAASRNDELPPKRPGYACHV